MNVFLNRMTLLRTTAVGVQGFLCQTDLFLIGESSLDQKGNKKIKKSKKTMIMTKI